MYEYTGSSMPSDADCVVVVEVDEGKLGLDTIDADLSDHWVAL